ncbi:MAG: rhomboid family intramembrane serine protease [Elusimicrobiota bacterium]
MTRGAEHSPLNFRMMSPIIKALIIANVGVFVLSLLVGGQFVGLFGLVPAKVVHERWIWQPFTYLFIHAGPFHLLINLFVLWMFGMAVEAQWGPREFLKYYLICGVGAGLFNVAVTPHSPVPIVGASGAIYGLLVAFAMLYPNAVVYLYFVFPIKAKHMAILVGVLEFLAATGSGSPMVARFAHLGGMIIGYLYIRWWWIVKIRTKGALHGWTRGRERPAAVPRRRRQAGKRTVELSRPADEMAEVDRILDKILDKGEAALTERERDILRRQAGKRPGGHA